MPILDKLDPYQYAMYRLYRDGTRYVDGKHIKDISHLNRDLSKVIMMDSNPEAFSMQPENGIALKPWKGEAGDHGLLDYIPFLEGKKRKIGGWRQFTEFFFLWLTNDFFL